MKHNYKIKIKEPDLTDEQIYAHKDFDAVFRRYKSVVEPLNRKPLYKNPKTFLGVLLFTVIGFLVYFAMTEEEVMKQKEEITSAVQKMREQHQMMPLPTPVDPNETKEEIPAGEAHKLNLPGGLLLEIPALAFVDDQGRPFEGAAQIEFRQMQDPQSLATRGLSLELSPEQGPLLDSRYAFEIKAWNQNRPLQLAPDASLSLHFPAEKLAEASPSCNLYHLDPVDKTWTLTQKEVPLIEIPQKKAEPVPAKDGFGMEEEEKSSKTQSENDMPKAPSQGKRNFRIDRLGVFNGGAVIDQTGWESHLVRFEDSKGNEVYFHGMYLLDRQFNTVQYLWPRSEDLAFSLKLNPGQDQLLAGITPDGKLAVVRAESLKKLPSGSKEVQTLKVEILEVEIKTIDDLKRALSFQHMA